MAVFSGTRVFSYLLLLCAAVFILQPVLAENGTITIAYRGSGGGYIGDSIVFDGYDTYGNTTLLKVSGPGLPAEGVQVNNLNSPAGTTTPVKVDPSGLWKFVWYASTVPGLEKLTTGRYTFTATDSLRPDKSATSFFMLKKREYSITASPNPVNPGKYVELTGSAEQGITFAKVDITDSSGNVLHTFTSPVSSSGYFNYGFHVDMGPGQYRVTVSNPELNEPFGTVISVVPEGGTPAMNPEVTTLPETPVPTAVVTAPMTAPAPRNPGQAKSPVAPLTIVPALIISAAGFGISPRKN